MVIIMLESRFKTNLRKRIEKEFPGAIVMHTNPSERRGAPDLVILYKDKWALLECKKSEKASHRPNQEYWIDLTNEMSFSRFIFPENRKEVLDELSVFFRSVT